MTDDDPYSKPVRTLEGGEPLESETLCGRPTCECPNERAPDLATADAMLERIYCIARELANGNNHSSPRRQGRRIMNIIERVDEALGLEDDA